MNMTSEINLTPWKNLIEFFDENYHNFIPRSPRFQDRQEEKSVIHKYTAKLLLETTSNDWREFLNTVEQDSLQKTKDFLAPFMARKRKEYPKELNSNLEKAVKTFSEFAEEALTEKAERDLFKIGQFCDAVDYLNKSDSHTFLFLYVLPKYVENEEISQLIRSSKGYQELVYWGATRFLDKFCFKLQRHFRITRTALKEEAAQNLVQELGAKESYLKKEIEALQQENETLKAEQEQLRDRAFQESLISLTQKLQNRPQPLLTQVFSYLKTLQKLSENQEGELSLSNREALGILITFEELIETLKSLNIHPFPENLNQTFTLKQEQLGEYNYSEGSSFNGENDKKTVRCITPGWKVGDTIITPAQVKEVTE